MADTWPRISTHRENVLPYDFCQIPGYSRFQISDIRTSTDAHTQISARRDLYSRSRRVVRPALTFTVYAYISTHV